jgi:hypothetical protein
MLLMKESLKRAKVLRAHAHTLPKGGVFLCLLLETHRTPLLPEHKTAKGQSCVCCLGARYLGICNLPISPVHDSLPTYDQAF